MKKSIATGAKRGIVGDLILEALSTGDKYGWEIMKAIEEKSNGEYILKEPSLYSSLKRMEVSGLITSYWQDSDIGGRRHYYNLTEKGLQKLNNTNLELPEDKQFATELFSEESGSSVDNSIKDLNKSVNEVQKTVNKLNKNEQEIKRFIETVESQEKTLSPIVEQPTKVGNKIVLPTINPMQQDLFSFGLSNIQPQKEQEEQKPVEQKPVEEQQLVEDPSQIKEEITTEKKEVVEAVKKEKYQKLPSSYMQMPMFEKEASVNLSGIIVEEEPVKTEPVAQVIEPTEDVVEPTKTQIKHIKSLATEREFLEIKNNFKNTNKSFLHKTEEYKPNFNYKLDTNLESSDTLYGSFNLKEEETETPKKFNNLGLEETLKAKQQEEQKEQEKIEETAMEEPVKQEVIEEDIDYKSILGELFSEEEEEAEFTSIKDLPRINVTDNVNISLKAKRKEEKEVKLDEPVYNASPTYSYNSFKEEIDVEEDYSYLQSNKELKNFHESLEKDEYSSSLLEDVYLNEITVKTHKSGTKAPLIATHYVSINKLNFNLSFAIFVLMLIQIVATYVGLTNAGHITTSANVLFIIAGVLTFLPILIYGFSYFINPLKKKEVNYNLVSKLGNNFIVLLITYVFIYAINLFLGMNSLNTMDFIASWLLPAILSTNLLFVPIIKFVLLKRKKYYL